MSSSLAPATSVIDLAGRGIGDRDGFGSSFDDAAADEQSGGTVAVATGLSPAAKVAVKVIAFDVSKSVYRIRSSVYAMT